MCIFVSTDDDINGWRTCIQDCPLSTVRGIIRHLSRIMASQSLPRVTRQRNPQSVSPLQWRLIGARAESIAALCIVFSLFQDLNFLLPQINLLHIPIVKHAFDLGGKGRGHTASHSTRRSSSGPNLRLALYLLR